MVNKLPEAEKKAIIEKILVGPAKRRPRFNYFEQFKDDMQPILEQLSQKECAAQIKKELIDEQNKELQIFIEA